ncbi:glycosyltransferase family 4 protein [Desulfomicrobium salsuginis]
MAEHLRNSVVIAVDCSVFAYSHGGLASFFRPYLLQMLRAYPQYRFYLVAPEIVDLDEWSQFSNVCIAFYCDTKPLFCGKGRSLRKIWELSIKLHQVKADFLLSPYYAFFIPMRYKQKSIITVHDTCFWDVPQFFSSYDRWTHKVLLAWNAHLAYSVLTVSEASKKRLLLNVPGLKEDAVAVVYNAWDDEGDLAQQESSYGSRLQFLLKNAPANLLLSSGGFSGTKNIDIVLKALRLAVDKREDIGLVLTGNARYAGELWQMIDMLELEEHVFPTGVVSDAEMRWLVSERCAAAVCMSRYEGFGRSLVEAMHAGLPLLCSDMSTNREVAGDYPEVYCAIQDVEALSLAMVNVVDSPKRAPVFDERFSLERNWKIFASRIDVVLQEVLGSGR